MKCEYCSNEHDGTYGSGRFCKQECSRGFSTKSRRVEINQRVSEKLKGKETWNKGLTGLVGLKGFKHSEETKEKIRKSRAIPLKDILTGKYPNYQSIKLKIRLINEGLLEDKCCKCGWSVKRKNAKYSACELHHRDGNPYNNKLENLEILCPNHHSLTENFRFNNKSHKKKNIIVEMIVL